MESDGLGYITVQEHVTPHIGSTGRYFGFSSEEEEDAYSSRKLGKPDYVDRYLPPQSNIGFRGRFVRVPVGGDDESYQFSRSTGFPSPVFPCAGSPFFVTQRNKVFWMK